MGYYTSFECNAYKNAFDAACGGFRRVIRNDDEVTKFAKELEDYVGSHADIRPSNPFEFFDYSKYKWYDCDGDMLSLSEKYPKYYYRIDAVGEDRYDMWRAIYHNGKMTKSIVEMSWPEFMLFKLD